MCSPLLDCCSCVIDAGEPVQIQAVLLELTVEAFDKGVLGQLSRLNEVQIHTGALCPEEHCFASQFGTVVANDGFG